MQKLTKAREGMKSNSVRQSGSAKEFTTRKKANHDFSLNTGSEKLEVSIEKHLSMDEKRLKLDLELFDMAQKQMKDEREQNANSMELLS